MKTNEVFSYEQVVQIATDPIQPLRNRALFVAEYLSGARVSEIVRRLKKRQIVFNEYKGRPFMMFQEIYTEKRSDHPLRNLPVNIERERTLVVVLQEYISQFADDDVIFNFSRVHAWRILKSMTGFGNHYQRHCRVTHWASIYGMNEVTIKKLAGWASPAMMKIYEHLLWQDLAGAML